MSALVVTIETVPGSVLLPNKTRRVHWSERSKEAGRLRSCAYYDTREQVRDGQRPMPGTPLAVDLHIAWPSSRTMPDLDNALSSAKAAIDGLCDALGVDDAVIQHIGISQGRCEQRNRQGRITATVQVQRKGPA